MDSTDVKATESPKKNIKSGSGDKAETDTDKVDDFKRGHRKFGGGWKPKYDRGGRKSPRDAKPYRQRKPVNADALSLEAYLSKEDKPIVYTLSPEKPEVLIEEWFKKASPSKVRRSDGVGWIYVLSETATEEDKKDLLETNGNLFALKEEWGQLTEKDDCEINFQTIKDLAVKHNCKGGKWLFHYTGESLDSIWKRVVLELVYKKFPPGVIGLKISPVNDMNIPGASSRGGDRENDHVIAILHRDMNNVDEIKAIEKVVRSIPIRGDMTYKPNIFSAIGIYRNNKFKLRPTIYVSSKEVKEDREEYVVKCCIEEEWSYKKGQETAENPTKDEEKANLINYLKDRIREMRLSLDDMNNKLIDDNKGNAEVKKNDKPAKKSLAETQKESSVIDDAKEVPKKTDENETNSEKAKDTEEKVRADEAETEKTEEKDPKTEN